jgi:outer membrane lipopolysaccharide assembly protein LptE/RlpB
MRVAAVIGVVLHIQGKDKRALNFGFSCIITNWCTGAAVVNRVVPFILSLAACILSGCGYHVAGRTSGLPVSVHTIAVVALENKTTSYRIEQKLTEATVREFLAATPYRIVSNPSDGDAILRGQVLNVEAVPLLFDTKSGRATTMVVTVECKVSLTDATTQKVLYHSDKFLFRNEYEISQSSNPQDLKLFFSEQDPALDRLAKDFAHRLVAAITENY